jgi:uncharacterized protein
MICRVGIIGAGPAGLAAAAALSARGCESVLFESGNSARGRDHRSASDIGVGVGSAGLFSDGKFSYFPSATGLYELGGRRFGVQSVS